MIVLFISIGTVLIRCVNGDCAFIPYITLQPLIVAGAVELILEASWGYIKIYRQKGNPKEYDDKE